MSDVAREELSDWLLAAERAFAADWGVDETDRTCESLEVVRFWINAYGRLLDFDERLLATIQERVETLPTVVRVEAEMTNIPVQEGQVERVRGRLDFWHRREAELLRRH